MLNTFLNYIKTKPVISLLYSLIASNILFLLLFQYSLKPKLLTKLSNNPELIDIPYYYSIIQSLHFAIILVLFILIIILLFKGWIRTFFDYLSSIKNIVYYFIGLNVTIQLILFFSIDTIPISDSKYYIEHAQRLTATGNYLNELGSKTAFWPVGLPALLAGMKFLFGDFIIAIKLFNIFINSSLILLLYKLFQKELTNKQMLLFLLAYTLFPNHLFSANVILTDFIFSFLFWLVLLLIVKRDNSFYLIVIVGIAIGIMCYFRPTALVMPLLLFLIWYKKDGFKFSAGRIVFISFIILLTLSPWIYRNYKVFQDFVPVSTNGGFNFLMGNHVNANGGLNFDFEYDHFNNEVDESNKAYKKALNDIVDNPINSLIRIPLKIFHSYKRGDSSITWALKNTSNRINEILLSIIFYITNGMFYLFVIISIVSYLRIKKIIHNQALRWALNLTLIYFITLLILYVGNERYVITIVPIHLFYFSRNFSI